MTTRQRAFIAEEQYLERELTAEWPSEYSQGAICSIEHPSFRHTCIKTNLLGALIVETKATGHRVLGGLRVYAAETGFYACPDLLVCGKPELLAKDPEQGTLTNPKVIVEVLSPSTQSYDRGDKFVHYRSVPSLCEYLLISQDKMLAEHWVKQPDGGWLFHQVSGPEASITLQSINVSFPLREAYDGVEL